jgi:hypothetical protein
MNKGLPDLERYRRLVLELVLEHAFEDVGDLCTRMRVFTEGHSRVEIYTHLDDLAPGDAQIVP